MNPTDTSDKSAAGSQQVFGTGATAFRDEGAAH